MITPKVTLTGKCIYSVGEWCYSIKGVYSVQGIRHAIPGVLYWLMSTAITLPVHGHLYQSIHTGTDRSTPLYTVSPLLVVTWTSRDTLAPVGLPLVDYLVTMAPIQGYLSLRGSMLVPGGHGL
jgi:hypothetical protein